MEEKIHEGRISFVQYEKKFVTIDYEHNGKQKQINGSIKDAAQQKLLDEKKIKKFHHFREGDAVTFTLTRSVRGDKMVADNIMFRFNNSLSNLLHKSKTENHFTGYLKQVDDNFFIKEIDSYQFFPLRLSPFEIKPTPATMNEPVSFRLHNISNPDKVTASLVVRLFTPAYHKLVKQAEKADVINVTVSKLTPHAAYVELGKDIQAKIPPDEALKVGDEVQIRIDHISPEKIVVSRI